MPAYVDTHCHLDHHNERSAAAQVEAAREAGVTVMVTVGTDMASSAQAVQTASRHEGVHAAVGVHPNDAMEATPRVLEVIEQLAGQEGVVAVGETGLDYYRDHTSPEQQQASFRAHIAIAKRCDKALVIHCRDDAHGGSRGPAWDDCLKILEDAGPPERVVMHCFSGDAEVVAHCAERGWYLSFAGNLTFANAEPLRLAAAAAPRDLVLTETDSPFLSPEPHRGSPNEPARIPFVLRTLAEVQSGTVDDVAAAVRANADRVFALG